MNKGIDRKQITNNYESSKSFISQSVFKEEVAESDKLLKWIYNIVILIGGMGFLCVGLSSYLKHNIIFFLKADQIFFYPQGLTMCFYGICAVIVSINQFRVLLNNIGEGFNEFNKDKKIMNIYRKGFKNSDVNIVCSLNDIVRA
jgi:hypothetical protein